MKKTIESYWVYAVGFFLGVITRMAVNEMSFWGSALWFLGIFFGGWGIIKLLENRGVKNETITE